MSTPSTIAVLKRKKEMWECFTEKAEPELDLKELENLKRQQVDREAWCRVGDNWTGR